MTPLTPSLPLRTHLRSLVHHALKHLTFTFPAPRIHFASPCSTCIQSPMPLKVCWVSYFRILELVVTDPRPPLGRYFNFRFGEGGGGGGLSPSPPPLDPLPPPL